MHQGIFKDISDPLNSMMTNKNFKEGAAGKIQHLDTEFTFELVIALCEFAYTGGIIQAVSKHRGMWSLRAWLAVNRVELIVI